MDENNKIQLFEEQAIRTAWDEEQEEWYFSMKQFNRNYRPRFQLVLLLFPLFFISFVGFHKTGHDYHPS